MTTRKASNSTKKGGRFLPALCNVLGTLILVGVFALTLPIVAPQVMGYGVYNVVSGSMEPEIPVGSVIYVKHVEPADLQEDDVIAFQHDGSMVAHRVVVNRTTLGELVTKGDANNVEDLDPIPYSAVEGKVEHVIPRFGEFMALYSSTIGKSYLLMALACGVMLNFLGGRLRRRRILQQVRARAASEAGLETGDEAAELADVESAQPVDPRTRRRNRKIRQALMVILAAIFICSGSVVGFVMYEHSESDKVFKTASEAYTKPAEASEPAEPGQKPPKEVDFDALRAVNPDVIGWIYCADTPIDYPVLHGTDNDQYLRRDYTGDYNIDGSIFIETTNAPDFSDSNTIIYGHHMSTGSMFACLDQWEEQEFYDKHPYLWLLTPTQNYRVDLISGRHTAATSDVYRQIKVPGEDLNGYLQAAVAQSYFKTSVQLDPNAKYVTLSTCAYIFDNARFVLHGKLVPVG